MPLGSRGSKYEANIHSLLSCSTDHEAIANSLYVNMAKNNLLGTKSTNCKECGSYITATRRAGGEWESRVFAAHSKER
jgi:hypothetical protein